MNKEEILKALGEVQHPAKDDRSVVELGMVEGIEVEGNNVVITLAFSKHRDPLAEYLIGGSRAAIIRHWPEAEVEVRTVVREQPTA
ncbi:MAG: iron-sulfur cluster assembly protein, partial [Bacteroidales bacterium]|nr:iron-sulfur cluster assembly protein [Bacteroidales bacterium]